MAGPSWISGPGWVISRYSLLDGHRTDGFLPTNRRLIRWRLLDKNLRLNGTNNVDVFPYAVSSKGGELTLDVSGGVAVQYRTVGDSSPERGKITVRSVALADVLSGLPGGVVRLPEDGL